MSMRAEPGTGSRLLRMRCAFLRALAHARRRASVSLASCAPDQVQDPDPESAKGVAASGTNAQS